VTLGLRKLGTSGLKIYMILKTFNFLGLNDDTDVVSMLFAFRGTLVSQDLKVFTSAIIMKFVLYSMNILRLRLGNMECK
jgi:hypothetical protein